MIGGIYSEERCPICQGGMKDNRKNAVGCPQHPNCKANKLGVRIKGLHFVYYSYEDARDYLNFLNCKIKERSFDDRDYRKDQPLGFTNLAKAYLDFKIPKRSYTKMKWHLGYAIAYFQNQNIKEIAEPELDDFFLRLPSHLSDKTKLNIRTTLHSFWAWVKRREKKRNPHFQIPEFPQIEFVSKLRKIIDKETQLSILDEVKRLTFDLNPRIYFACLCLSTYSHVRGIELLDIKEKDIDLRTGRLEVYHTKEKKPKVIKLIQEDIDFIKSQPSGFPELYFFRHTKKIPGLLHSQVGKRFGESLLKKWWRRACKNLGIEGVPIYPGTRHSTLSDVSERFGYEAARQLSGHTTSKSLDHYIIPNQDAKKDLYAYARSGKDQVKDFEGKNKSKVVDFKDKR